MRNGQNKHHRMRGRNRGSGGGGGKNHNPLTRVYESNGPDVKIRGTANHVAEKYIQLARDATASGDPVAAENYYQHAEHYFRLIAAAQEQFRQTQPFQQQQQRQDGNDENFDGDDDAQPSSGEPHYTPREQPYPQQRDFQQHRQHNNQPRHERNDQPRQERAQQAGNNDGDVGGLPSFITGTQPQQGQPQNGHEGQGGGQSDRFPLNRRRRRHRGPSQDVQDGGEEASGHTPAAEQPNE